MNMDIQLRYFNIIASTLNVKTEERSMREGTTFRDLAEMLANEKPSFRVLAFESEKVISKRIRFFRNSMIVQSLDEIVQEGDVISIFPAVSGG